MANIASTNSRIRKNIDLSKEIKKFDYKNRSIDYMTLLGLAISISIIVSVVLIGGNPNSFIDIRSILVVIGGTITITMISFAWRDFKMAGQVIWQTFMNEYQRPKDVATQMVILAEFGRTNGTISLEKFIDNYKQKTFMRKGLELVIDNTLPKDIEELLTSQINAMEYRHWKSTELVKKAADAAPAMGLIGTLIGLVQMLSNLNDPSQIGPSMAIAILTTFYGALLGNMLLGPLAIKLERNSKDEITIMRLKLLGLLSISKQENPRKLEHLMNTILSPENRINYFR